MNPARVGLIGFYGVGNYGDDLMAHLCADHLVEQGFPCTLFTLGEPGSDSLAKRAFERPGILVTRDPRELVSTADILVWGGGGLLVSWNDRTFRRRFPGVAEKLLAAVQLARQKGLVRCAVSVGGNGGTDTRLSPEYKRLFMDGARYASVRNPSDLALLQTLGVEGEVFPDLVWRAGTPALRHRPPGDRLRIGLDVYLANLADRRGLYFAAILQALVWRCPHHTFVCLNSTDRGSRRSSPLGRWNRLYGGNVEHYQFNDFADDASTLASLDLLLSSRLHVPVVCLAHHVPVVWTFCEKKTQVFLRTLGLEAMDFGHGRILEFTRTLTRRDRLDAFLADYPFPDVAGLFHASGGHLQQLVNIVQAVRGSTANDRPTGP